MNEVLNAFLAFVVPVGLLPCGERQRSSGPAWEGLSPKLNAREEFPVPSWAFSYAGGRSTGHRQRLASFFGNPPGIRNPLHIGPNWPKLDNH